MCACPRGVRVTRPTGGVVEGSSTGVPIATILVVASAGSTGTCVPTVLVVVGANSVTGSTGTST